MSGARELTYLCRELKHPALLAGVERLADRARSEAWSHEEFLAAGGSGRSARSYVPVRMRMSL